MTPQQFLKNHNAGDYTTWDDAAFELYGQVATPGGAPVPDHVFDLLKQPPPPKAIAPATQPAA